MAKSKGNTDCPIPLSSACLGGYCTHGMTMDDWYALSGTCGHPIGPMRFQPGGVHCPCGHVYPFGTPLVTDTSIQRQRHAMKATVRHMEGQ